MSRETVGVVIGDVVYTSHPKGAAEPEGSEVSRGGEQL